MRKKTQKSKKDVYLKDGVKGFIIAAIPIVLLDVAVLFSLGFFKEFLLKILTNIIIYGSIGVVVSIIHTYFHSRYPKQSNYVLYTIITMYYAIYLIYFIATIYLRDKII